MTYLLDTNTCIQYLNGRSRNIAERLGSMAEGDAVVCSVVRAEMLFGAMRSQNPARTLAGQRQFMALFPSLAFDDTAADHYAQIRADLSARGTPIGGNDLLIAAIALANNLILVTHNTREFSRIKNLIIEDWEVDGG
jgi:tRNA(fMet)-specific endonuclease VapC